MKKTMTRIRIPAKGILFIMFMIISGQLFAVPEDYISPAHMAVSQDGNMLFIAKSTQEKIGVYNITRGTLQDVVTAGNPGGVALSGQTLYYSLNQPEGMVYAMNTSSLQISLVSEAGHSPVDITIHPNGNILYTANQFSNDISVVNITTGAEETRIPVLREPSALAITPDGNWLFAANLLPSGAADRDLVTASVSVINTTLKRKEKDIPLVDGSTALRGICVSPDGAYVYVSHLVARYQLPTTQLERGWMMTNAISVIQVDGLKRLATVLLDDIDLGAPNPAGLVCSGGGEKLVIALAGSHELMVLDRKALHQRITRVLSGQQASDVMLLEPDPIPPENDLSFLVGIKKRIPLKGRGPRELAVSGSRIFTAQYFSGTVEVIDLSKSSEPSLELALGKVNPMDAVRRGEFFYNDGSRCFQKWQSCVSCHPDARADGLNWDLGNDGLGSMRNTKSHLFSHVTPPTTVTGCRPDAYASVRAGFKYIEFTDYPEADSAAVDDYLKALSPVESPYLEKGQLSLSARRGKTLFEGKASCISCHSGPLYTDMKLHKTKTGGEGEDDLAFDTPTLKEIWRTAPYLQDGRAYTILEVLRDYNPSNSHGTTGGLTAQELEDLANYVLSL